MRHDISRILFVINKTSGRKDFDWQAAITGYLNDEIERAYFFMPVEDCESLLRAKINDFQPTLIAAVGGDGTVNLVARLAMASGITMAILPAGSANGMAKELGIPEEAPGALECLLNGVERSTDIIKINDEHLCLHLSDIGLNARLIKYFEEGSVRGKLGYAFALVKALWKKQRMTATVRTKTGETVRSAVMVLIANASKYGTGAVINPVGSIYDGLFEVIIIRKINPFAIIKMFMKFQRFSPKNIEIFQASSVNIKTKGKTHFQVDGEYLGKISEVKATVAPAALKLIVPAE
jgi:diacylglycerol kinase (ATP)